MKSGSWKISRSLWAVSISDLRLLCSRERVRQALKQLKAEDYSPAQWQDAAHYLMF